MTSARSNSPRKLSEHTAPRSGFKARLVQPRLEQLGQGVTEENTVFYDLRIKLPGANSCYTQKQPTCITKECRAGSVKPCADPRTPTERPSSDRRRETDRCRDHTVSLTTAMLTSSYCSRHSSQ